MDRLYCEIASVLERIPVDFGGGCSVSKAYLIAWLIRHYHLSFTVDIGVYRGRSFFPQAVAQSRYVGGVVFGVDPWSATEAREYDHPQLQDAIMRFVNETDFPKIYEQVEATRTELHLEDHSRILRQTSAEAAQCFRRNGTSFGLVHVDGNHDEEIVSRDIELYLPLLSERGFVVLDDISWDSVRPAYQKLAARTKLVFQRQDTYNDYAVFWYTDSWIRARALAWILRNVGSG